MATRKQLSVAATAALTTLLALPFLVALSGPRPASGCSPLLSAKAMSALLEQAEGEPGEIAQGVSRDIHDAGRLFGCWR